MSNFTPEDFQQLRRQLRMTQRVAGIGSWEWDLASGRVTWSEEMFPLHGLTPEEFGGTAADYLPLVHPEDRERIEQLIAELLAGGRRGAVEYRIVRPADGEVRDMWGTNQVVRDADGEPNLVFGTVLDISELRRTKRALSVSEERFSSAFDCSMTGLAIEDSTGRFLEVNRALEEITGFPRKELLGESQRLFLTEDGDHDGETLRRRIIVGESAGAVLERQAHRKDGSELYVQVAIAPLKDGNGSVSHFLLQVLDLTDRHRAQDALRQSEERFRSLIENSYDVTTVFDSEGTVLYTTPSARRILGYRPEELIGQSGAMVVHPEDAAEAAASFASALASPGARVHNTHRIRRADGETRWVEIVGTNLLDRPPVQGVVSNLRDITDRVLGENALRRSESDYRNLVDHAVFGIYRSTADGKLLTVNPAMVEMLGFESPDELLAHPMSALYEDPEERLRLVDELTRRPSPYSVELQWKRRDGQKITVRLSGRPILAPEGAIECFETVVEDVSEQRFLEAQLRQAQKMEAVGRLAGGVAHDFNNLLTVILGEADMLLAGSGDADAARAVAKRIRDSADRAAVLTRRLLGFSRQQASTMGAVDLNEVVTSVANMLRRLIEENVQLKLKLTPALRPLRADRGQLEQVLINLAINARDSMRHGGVITLETANADLSESFAARYADAKAGEYVQLIVSDTGAGISEGSRAHIFEPFYTTKGEQGTGLGLATCYNVVRSHGGFIDLESEVGAGSTFRVYLPREAPAEADQPEEAHPAEVSGEASVLLVEDEIDVRDVISKMLESYGYQVSVAPDAEKALRLAAGGSFDLLVTDVVLPRMGGRQLAEKITSLHPQTRVLFVSGYNDDPVLRRRVEDNGYLLLPKPFDLRELVGAVRQALSAPLAP